ncbi:hypothetical protein ACFX2G_022407 [Malus domestica]
MGYIGEAMKLWFEMIVEGYHPNEYIYNTIIFGFCKIGSLEEAKIFYKEMSDKGRKETTVGCNAMMRGLCLHGRTDEAYRLFTEMPHKGIPSTYSYTPLIEKLCQVGAVQEAQSLWNDIKSRGLEPTFGTQDYILIKLCDQGDAAEGMEWFFDMLTSKLKPKWKTFGRLVECLSQGDRLDV